MKKNICYISYDSMDGALGKSQVLSYLNNLSVDFKIFLISFEKNKNFKIINKNISWLPLVYHKKFSVISTVYDIAIGFYNVIKINKKNKLDILHCRSYISGIIGLLFYFTHNTPFIFDMRGFWIDEKIESGSWSNIIFYPVIIFFRFIEKILLFKSKSIVVLTFSAKEFLINKYNINPNKISVIPTCVNYSVFFDDFTLRQEGRSELNISEDEILIIFSGSIGGYYNLDYILDFFEQFDNLFKVKLLLLTQSSHKNIILQTKLRKLENKVIVKSCDYLEVNKFINASDVGLILYEKTISSIARSSTKLGEYWACKIPVIAPKNVGDLNTLFLKNNQFELLYENFDSFSYRNSILAYLRNRTKFSFNQGVKDYYDLSRGVKEYKNIYTLILYYE